MVKVEKKHTNMPKKYIIGLIFTLLFIFNDLFFEFGLNFESSDYISFAFTVLTAILVIWFNKSIKREKYENITEFVRSNFDNAQVVFSILDIVCGLISITSVLLYLSCLFKFVKFCYVPIKVLVVINKEKTLLKPITKFSYLWTSMRILDIGDFKMANWFKRNKISFIVSILGFIVCGMAGYFTSMNLFTLPTFACYIIGGVCAVLSVVLVMVIGAENAIEFFTRVSVTKLPKEYQDKVVQAIEGIEAEVKAEAEKIAKDKEVANRVEKKYRELVAEQEASLKAKAEQLVKAENEEA